MTDFDLKAWRGRLNWSQREAAYQHQVTLQTYQNWEHGITRQTGRPLTLKQSVIDRCQELESDPTTWRPWPRRMGVPPDPEKIRIRRTNERPVITGRAVHWLSVVAMIAERRVNSSAICEALGITRNSFTRYMADIERIYGVIIHYERRDGKYPGWYVIDDWGVLNPEQVGRRYRTTLTHS